MIEAILLSELCPMTHGSLGGPDLEFSSVSIDTRNLKSHEVYVALKGETFDGHDFVSQAIDAGCSGLILEKTYTSENGVDSEFGGLPVLNVDDTQQALGVIANKNRQRFNGKVVGLTGSSGKTTTKNMLASILSEKGAVSATKGNFNNEIGVPLTLLAIDKSHDFAVIEMGARAKGDINYLSSIVQPDIAIVLNAGQAHIDVFGGYENIVEAKGELFESLKLDGVGVVNYDDGAYKQWLGMLNERHSLSFSISNKLADVYASELKCSAEGSQFTLNYGAFSQLITLAAPGKHNVSNSLAAASAAISMGFGLSEIALGLSKFKNDTGRLGVEKLTNELTLIDDSYNANPSSMKAALDVLSLRSGHKVAVLGEMAELGAQSRAFHADVAEYANTTAINMFYLLGSHANKMAELIDQDRAIACVDKGDVVNKLFADQQPQETILVKGSRSSAMDEVVNMIKKRIH
jgi:UDP-N-acetylmuramoyl-tripeptide--D-alanyl-D-alanine ligase